MGESSSNSIKYAVIVFLLVFIVAGLFFLPLILSRAQSQQNSYKPGIFSESLTANTICSAGLGGCERASQNGNGQDSGSLFSGIFGLSGGKAEPDPIITVVNVAGQTAVYRIINGKKHSIPTEEIFNSYGFDLDIVQKISQEEFNKYPLARLFMLAGEKVEDKTVYYLTDEGTIRPILNDKIFYSYGNRKEDVIFINQKELNYYPRNQFIFIERPQIDRDIYQISGGIKRYLTPVAVQRMNIREDEVAPVNQIEFDEYPTGEPVIF